MAAGHLDARPALGFSVIHHDSHGEFDQALSFAQRMQSAAPGLALWQGLVAGLLARTGDTTRADDLLTKKGPPTTCGVPRAFVMYYLVQGDDSGMNTSVT